MLSSSRFVLRRATLTVDASGEKQVLVTLPSGAIIDVLSEPDLSQMVRIRCEGRVLSMFSVDLQERGEQVSIAATGD